jgi:hypothetical protein
MRTWQQALAWTVAVALATGCGSDGNGSKVIDEDFGTVDMGRVPDAAPDALVEPDAAVTPACSDGQDNDGDGKIDAADPGCGSPDDRDETDPPPPPVCSNGQDDDQDGYTDYPEDPGCASGLDQDETNDSPQPQCGDGQDNDRDGLIDDEDPGCSSVADPSENDPMTPPKCSNGLDDDQDGIVDFPAEPGCNSAGDDDETDPPMLPACGNGVDDDHDGKTDYPADPGCAGVGDRDETDPAIEPECANGRDDDGDGLIDYPADDGCVSAADHNEQGSCGHQYSPASLSDGQTIVVDTSRGVFRSQGSCGGVGSPEVVYHYRLTHAVEALSITTVGEQTQVPTTLYVRLGACLDAASEVACDRESLDQPMPGHTLTIPEPAAGDYYIFVDGVSGHGGQVQLKVSEVPRPQCRNGVDDDGDGRIDYPEEPGCTDPNDVDEADPEVLPACANDADDDGDGRVDYPLDTGCIAASGASEVDSCGQGVRFREWPFGATSVQYDTRHDATNNAAGTCGGQGQPEVIIVYHNAINARLTFTIDDDATDITPVLYARRDCANPQSEVACVDGSQGGPLAGRLVIDRAAVGDQWIFVDSGFGQPGRFKLDLDVHPLAPGCSDAADDDGDALIDADDPGCEGPDDQDERDPPRGTPAAACNNGLDDDGDGFADYPYDPGCSAAGDPDEADPAVSPQCSNGLDDDMDGKTDFPVDPGCQSRGDDDERNVIPPPQCGNVIDDDQDGLADYPVDPGCTSAGDNTEADPNQRPVCANGIDDDRDGIADFPFDPGCSAASDPDETDPDVPPTCHNGMDDDQDGLTDFPLDPGCLYAADDSENNAGFPPQCANMMDDDADGRVDFPDDPGCRFAADNDETNPGFLPPRCADGVDNDFDGATDLQDVGCLDGDDDDEADPDTLPECGNMQDDDGDGLVDWPDDPGCRARGDLSESQACRPEIETPVIPQNGSVMGETHDGDMDVYHARCGGRGAPEAVYRYSLAAPADLRISAANPGTDYPAVVYVRSDCEEPTSGLTCAGDLQHPEPTVTLPNAQPGEYFIFVDGGGPERFVSTGGQVNLPPDPNNFQASHNDFQPNCGWGDGGRDAFDCFGVITVSFMGNATDVDPTPGQRQLNAGGYAFRVVSDFAAQNVWRVQFLPQEEFDDRRVSISITGNMGSDGATRAMVQNVELEGRQIPYEQSSDNFAAPGDPPVLQMLVPSDPDDFGRVQYLMQADSATTTANDIKLPATFYVALTYANVQQVASAIVTDLELEAGPGGEDAPRFGHFELSVQEQ